MARTGAERAGVPNIEWIVRRAENIGPDLGRFHAVTFAQSFHWVNRPKVAGLVLEVLEPGGACVVVYATTHAGVDDTGPLPLAQAAEGGDRRPDRCLPGQHSPRWARHPAGGGPAGR